MNFDDFFKAATGHPTGPFDYQRRLAGGDRGGTCESRVIAVPTGLGKTAGAVLAWLYNRVGLKRGDWPRRLVYCLPMRTLVEQTRDNVADWLHKLAKAYPENAELKWLTECSPVILMGGEELKPEKRDWDIHPERPCVLIGTQDMLLSRALNRGYGMSRYRWPMHFGLLNNDCLWVMDETQLMGVGVETSAQLDGFRHEANCPVFGGCPTWWMSATLDPKRLATVDHRASAGSWSTTELEGADRQQDVVKRRLGGAKPLKRAAFALSGDGKKTYAAEVARLVKDRHVEGTLSLVVVNTVGRSQDVFRALRKLGVSEDCLALVHSRFRAADRAPQQGKLAAEGDRIIVATQAVEAGVDVSARLLVTELAPWSSLVQRFGRCNRRGEQSDAEVVWIDWQAKDDKDAAPYVVEELKVARTVLADLKDVGARSLEGVAVSSRQVVRPVLRRKDLLDLFDTTPDLAGHDLDISRYIRDGEDTDVQIFWRDLAGQLPPAELATPSREELCRVSLPRFREFLKQKSQPKAWVWTPHDDDRPWQTTRIAHAGGTYLLDQSAGGYADGLGWTGDPKDQPTPCPPKDGAQETYGGNRLSFDREWQTLAEHTAKVIGQMDALATALNLGKIDSAALRTAALWHDVGKAHKDFQEMLRDGPHKPEDAQALCAKSKNPPKPPGVSNHYRSLRHELAAALAWLLAGPSDAPGRDLVAYLIGAHHGKVRLSIRSLPNEPAPNDDRLFARGVWDGDTLPSVPLGDIATPCVTLDLSFMQMGEGPHGPSWLARAVALRQGLGPFRLAYLETLLRAADARASGDTCPKEQRSGGAGVSLDMELREPSALYGSPQGLSAAEQSLVADLVADGLSIQDKFRPEPLYRQTGKGHYAGKTVEEIQQAKRAKSKGEGS